MFTETLQTAVESILMMVLTLVIPALVAYGMKKVNDFVKVKVKASNSEYVRNMFEHIGDTIESVVNQTTQTYVKELKDLETFDLGEQRMALQITKEKLAHMINAESVALIEMLHGDAGKWIETQVESIIAKQKNIKTLVVND